MRFLSYLVILLFASLIAACGGGGGSPGLTPGGGTQAFFTTAPSDLTLTLGSSQNFTVGGGKGPFSATSNDTSVAMPSLIDSTLTLGAVTPGNATITLRDALGATQTVAVTVKPSRALFTTAPSAVTLAIGNQFAQTFTVGGGVGPYVVGNSNSSVVSASLSGTSLVLTGLASGTANLVILDSVGGSLGIAVTVPAVTGVELFTTAAPAVTLPNASSATYVIGGGTSPYSATSANASVAAVSVSGSTLKIEAGISGNTTVTVRDNAGHTVPVAVTVAPAFNFFTTAPTAVTVAVNSTATFSVGGGVPPYTAASGSPGVATASISGTTLSIKGLSNGTAPVVLRDSALATIPISVTVSPASSLSLFTTAPATGLTIAKGTTTTFAIGGGAPPYTVTSSNASVASVALSGSSYTITGVANGVASLSIRDSAGTAIPVAVAVSAAQLSLNPTAVSAFLGDTVFSTISGGTAPFSVVEGFPDAADVDVGNLVNNVFVPSLTGNGNILRIVIKQVVASDIIQVRDATGNSVNFTLTATAGTNAITLAPAKLTIGEENTGPIQLILFGGVGVTNIFSSNPDLISAPGPVTASVTGTPVVVTASGGGVCSTGQVTITAIDSLGAKAETAITVEDHGGNPDPCPPVVPTP